MCDKLHNAVETKHCSHQYLEERVQKKTRYRGVIGVSIGLNGCAILISKEIAKKNLWFVGIILVFNGNPQNIDQRCQIPASWRLIVNHHFC